MVNAMPLPLYPRQRPGTHCIGDWVGHRAGQDGCGISRTYRDAIYCANPHLLYYSLREYNLIAPFSSTPTFSGTKLEHKRKASCQRTDTIREQKRLSRNVTNTRMWWVGYIVKRGGMTVLQNLI